MTPARLPPTPSPLTTLVRRRPFLSPADDAAHAQWPSTWPMAGGLARSAAGGLERAGWGLLSWLATEARCASHAWTLVHHRPFPSPADDTTHAWWQSAWPMAGGLGLSAAGGLERVDWGLLRWPATEARHARVGFKVHHRVLPGGEGRPHCRICGRMRRHLWVGV